MVATQGRHISKDLSQNLLTMPKIVFNLIPFCLENIDALIFNLPACPAT